MALLRVLSGVAPYDDPWHPFPETSAAAAEVLRGAGYRVEVLDSTPEALGSLDEVDLLVVNCGRGDGRGLGDSLGEWTPAFAAADAWLAAGGVVLGLHTAANTFHDWPTWAGLLGGRWVPGHSFHPPLDEVGFDIVPGAADHPVLAGLSRVQVADERYSDLVVDEGVTPLLQHHHEGVAQVMAWAAERAVYDGMGHDGRSYESADRQCFLVNAADWLLSLR
ncbi:ThuA domain-containing protein [Propionibacteriaceae bacterium Y1923]|uniref:ThuA domain-containing protein n=1 Tax=Aestuariimicrobium sp. Y1814 TaxID=3418742 RepID=UPI003C1A4B03